VPAYSVQYHPEASPGPHDSAGLFDRFVELMEAA
jgi:carbamoyl-phosphate synthase small subunit